MKHTGYNSDAYMYAKDGSLLRIRPVPPLFITSYDYKYNGQEYQDELGLNVTAMDFRQYDMALGRFNSIDVLSEIFYNITAYAFSLNLPTLFGDPTGLCPECVKNVPNPTNGASYVVNGINYIFNGNDWIGQIPEVVVNADVKKKSSQVDNNENSNKSKTRLSGLIKNANVNSKGQSPLEVYREQRGNPGYNPNEDKWDRIFRLIGNSHIEIMQDFGGGGYNMYGGYSRTTKAFNAAAYAEEVVNLNKATEGGGVLLSSTPEAAVNSAMYYSSEAQQGASIFRSIISNHMFIDGNKRTAIESFKLFAQQRGLNTVSTAQMQDVANKVAKGQITDIAEIARLLIK